MFNPENKQWVNGWGDGLTGPNTPSVAVTVRQSIDRYDYRHAADNWTRHRNNGIDTGPCPTPPPCEDYFIPISEGTDTIAIVVGPDREVNAQAISALPDLLAACKAALDLYPQTYPCESGCFELTHIDPFDWKDVRRQLENAVAKAEVKS
jgi:hypothetical protein